MEFEHLLFKREAEEDKGEEKESIIKKVEHELEKDVNLVAEKTHMKPWMVLTIVGVIIVLVLAGIGWCIYRFFKKKRPKGAEGKDGQDDENALVENEEAKGRIRFRLEYDFTLQELKVTIIECAELPPSD